MSRYFAGTSAQYQEQQGKGRPKGSQNKVNSTVRWNLVEAHRQLGGVEGLVKWGKRNRGEFYKLLVKVLPSEIADHHGVGDRSIKVMILPPDAKPPQTIDITRQSQAQSLPIAQAMPDEGGGGSSAGGGGE